MLTGTWWVVFPLFSALSIRLAVERACFDPYDLLPAVMSDPVWAWPLAAVYVAAHVWMVAAYLLTVSAKNDLLPAMEDIRSFWGGARAKIFLMLAAFAIEHLPMPIWQLIGARLHCAR